MGGGGGATSSRLAKVGIRQCPPDKSHSTVDKTSSKTSTSSKIKEMPRSSEGKPEMNAIPFSMVISIPNLRILQSIKARAVSGKSVLSPHCTSSGRSGSRHLSDPKDTTKQS